LGEDPELMAEDEGCNEDVYGDGDSVTSCGKVYKTYCHSRTIVKQQSTLLDWILLRIY
jgi:hypothetical protein